MTTKVFVCRPEALDAMFRGFRRALATRGSIEGVNPFTKEPMSFGTWDPSPDAPFPDDVIASLDDVPGEVVDWRPGAVSEVLSMVARRSTEGERVGPVMLGPHGREVFAIAPAAIDALVSATEPLADFAERMARLQLAAGHADEHGEELDPPLETYLDVPIDVLRDVTFRVESLDEDGYGSRPWWESRFENWRETIEAARALAATRADGERIHFVRWLDPDPVDDEPLPIAQWGSPPGSTPEQLRVALAGSPAPHFEETHYATLRAAFEDSEELDLDLDPVVSYVWVRRNGRIRSTFMRRSDGLFCGCLDGVERIEGTLDELIARANEPRPPLETEHRQWFEVAFVDLPDTEMLYDDVSFTASTCGNTACFVRKGEDRWFLRLEVDDHEGDLDHVIDVAVTAWPGFQSSE